MVIKKEDLNILAIDLMNLRFNTDGYNLICEYIEEKLIKDGVEITIDTTKETGKFNGVIYDYSIKSKKEGIKEMVSKIVESGELRGLSGEDAVGVWLNHAVEFMGRRITESICDKFEEIAQSRGWNVWNVYGMMDNDNKLKDLDGVDIYKMQEMWDRMIKNIKTIRYEEFARFNKFVW